MLADRPVGSPAGMSPARASWARRLSERLRPGVCRATVSTLRGRRRLARRRRASLRGSSSRLTHSASYSRRPATKPQRAASPTSSCSCAPARMPETTTRPGRRPTPSPPSPSGSTASLRTRASTGSSVMLASTVAPANQ